MQKSLALLLKESNLEVYIYKLDCILSLRREALMPILYSERIITVNFSLSKDIILLVQCYIITSLFLPPFTFALSSSQFPSHVSLSPSAMRYHIMFMISFTDTFSVRQDLPFPVNRLECSCFRLLVNLEKKRK